MRLVFLSMLSSILLPSLRSIARAASSNVPKIRRTSLIQSRRLIRPVLLPKEEALPVHGNLIFLLNLKINNMVIYDF